MLMPIIVPNVVVIWTILAVISVPKTALNAALVNLPTKAPIAAPMPNTVIYKDDILMVAGSDADLAKLPQE